MLSFIINDCDSRTEKDLKACEINFQKVNTDEDVVKSLMTQNRHIAEGLDWDKERAKVCYRRRARNDLECHPVLESPPVQCSRCLGCEHSKQYSKDVSDKCAHCGRTTSLLSASPEAQLRVQYPSQIRRDSSGKSGVLLATGTLNSLTRTQMAGGSSAEKTSDHLSLRFIQFNLQQSKLATSELLVEAERQKIAVGLVQEPYIGNIGEQRRYLGCRVVQKATLRRGPVKAAMI
ncbi:hypothetical protein EVAR_21877_1 [Eumeta japonica]|uniref:Uncharacterized protein n=1 Tax=Eumeta variegata TaxID=151549 RepID=A0A4C1V7I1_EUMVA|nr:hypothetical protein EVAR_21877_1 [Eumeta japonica]